MEETKVREPPPRRFNITRQDLEAHGYTAKCPGCTAILRGTARQAHSEQCRARMEKDMKEEPKVKAARERADEYITERLQEADAKRRRTGEGGQADTSPSADPEVQRQKRQRDEDEIPDAHRGDDPAGERSTENENATPSEESTEHGLKRG